MIGYGSGLFARAAIGLAAVAAPLALSPAAAVSLRYTIVSTFSGGTPAVYNTSFMLDRNPAAGSYIADTLDFFPSITFQNVSVTVNGSDLLSDIRFYTDGGFDLGIGATVIEPFTPVLFTSNADLSGVAMLTLTGAAFDDFSNPDFSHFVSITLVRDVVLPPGAVPEPASWAMMILGFGVVGAMLRRRGVRGAAVHLGVSGR